MGLGKAIIGLGALAGAVTLVDKFLGPQLGWNPTADWWWQRFKWPWSSPTATKTVTSFKPSSALPSSYSELAPEYKQSGWTQDNPGNNPGNLQAPIAPGNRYALTGTGSILPRSELYKTVKRPAQPKPKNRAYAKTAVASPSPCVYVGNQTRAY